MLRKDDSSGVRQVCEQKLNGSTFFRKIKKEINIYIKIKKIKYLNSAKFTHLWNIDFIFSVYPHTCT